MDDLISRQVVLKELNEYILNPRDVTAEHPDDIHYYNSGLYTAIEAVTDIPSVQPTQKKGKWIDLGRVYECSVCHERSCCAGNYCPDCGAEMEKEA